MVKNRDNYFTQSQVTKRHGWSAAMVRNLLGEPDTRVGNLRNPKNPTKLYLITRVEAAEATPEFAEASAKTLARTKNRRESQAKARAELRALLVEQTRPDDVPDVTFAELAEWTRAELDAWAAPLEEQARSAITRSTTWRRRPVCFRSCGK